MQKVFYITCNLFVLVTEVKGNFLYVTFVVDKVRISGVIECYQETKLGAPDKITLRIGLNQIVNPLSIEDLSDTTGVLLSNMAGITQIIGSAFLSKIFEDQYF